ncbi:MAG: Ig-like domain-containing protein, partial [Candidatus Eremiobacterota bacterium]
MVLTALLLSGCSEGGGATPASNFVVNGGGQPGGGGGTDQPAPTTGNLILRHTLDAPRAVQGRVPVNVTHFQVTGLDLAGNAVFPTQVFEKAPVLDLTVPLELVRLRIEYLENGQIVGVALVSVAMSPGGTVEIVDPERVQVASVLASIAVTPGPAQIAAGTAQGFQATGTFSDGTTQDLTGSVTWSSTAPAVATVSNAPTDKGLATGLTPGTGEIRATYGPISSGATLTVTNATLRSITVTPVNPSLAIGLTRQLNANGVFSDGTNQDLTGQVAWSSATPGSVTVSPTGLAAAVGLGTSDVSAALNGVTGGTRIAVTDLALVSIVVTPANPSLAQGTNLQLTATGTFTDGSTADLTSSVTWSTTSGAAAVSNAPGLWGLLNGLAVGGDTVTATRGGISGSTGATVTAATLSSITVTPALPALPLGVTQQFTATGVFSDATTQDLTGTVTWTSTSAGLPISNAAGTRGQAQALGTGPSTVSATLGAVSGSTQAQVTPASLTRIDVTPVNPGVALGFSVAMQATGVYTDATTVDLTSQATWTATAGTGTASISNAAGSHGVATGTGVGTATLGATFDGVSGNTVLTTSAATLVSIQVTPGTPSLGLGATQAFTATGTFSDGTVAPLTPAQVSWTSTATGVGTVDANGLFTTVAPGQTQVVATSGAIQGFTTVTVTVPVLTALAVSPDNPSIARGTTQQFTAMGTFTDG